MADATKILADIDAQWESAKGKIIAAQEDYAGKEGRYFQLLPTMTTAPKDGAAKSPDKLTEKPHYQDKSTAQLAADYAIPIPTLAGLEIHQYKQPNGVIGYVAYLTAQVTNEKGVTETWTRAENFGGDENYRTHEWKIVTAPDAKAVGAQPVTPETNALLNAAMAIAKGKAEMPQPPPPQDEWAMRAFVAIVIVLAIVLAYVAARYAGLVP